MKYAVKLPAKNMIPEKVSFPDDARFLDSFYKSCDCDMMELVYPSGLQRPYVLAVDEEGTFKEAPVLNVFASWLYKMQIHGTPIVGDCLILKEVMAYDGKDVDFLTEQEAEKIMNDLKKTEKVIKEDIWNTIKNDSMYEGMGE